MEDGKRFKLGIGTASWNGYPVHDACEQWITTNPDGTPAAAPHGATVIRTVNEDRAAAGMFPVPEPAPHSVMLRFPHITAGEVMQAKLAQTGGRAILVTGAQPGDKNLCFYRLPDIPKYLTLDGDTVAVAGGGPLDGGFTLVMLRIGATAAYAACTLATASDYPPRAAGCSCARSGIDWVDRAVCAAHSIPPPQVTG